MHIKEPGGMECDQNGDSVKPRTVWQIVRQIVREFLGRGASIRVNVLINEPIFIST